MARVVPFLVQLPGFGLLMAMTVLAAIGEIARFGRAKKLVGYAGLGVSIHDSGETRQERGITKSGRRDLRTALIEAAWSAVENYSFWKEQFERLLHHLRTKPSLPSPAIFWWSSGMCGANAPLTVAMSNHVHYLMAPARPADLPRILHWLNGYTAMCFNQMLGRTGHFWEGRYHSCGFPLTDNLRALNTLRYIHANPRAAGVRAGYTFLYKQLWDVRPPDG